MSATTTTDRVTRSRGVRRPLAYDGAPPPPSSSAVATDAIGKRKAKAKTKAKGKHKAAGKGKRRAVVDEAVDGIDSPSPPKRARSSENVPVRSPAPRTPPPRAAPLVPPPIRVPSPIFTPRPPDDDDASVAYEPLGDTGLYAPVAAAHQGEGKEEMRLVPPSVPSFMSSSSSSAAAAAKPQPRIDLSVKGSHDPKGPVFDERDESALSNNDSDDDDTLNRIVSWRTRLAMALGISEDAVRGMAAHGMNLSSIRTSAHIQNWHVPPRGCPHWEQVARVNFLATIAMHGAAGFLQHTCAQQEFPSLALLIDGIKNVREDIIAGQICNQTDHSHRGLYYGAFRAKY